MYALHRSTQMNIVSYFDGATGCQEGQLIVINTISEHSWMSPLTQVNINK